MKKNPTYAKIVLPLPVEGPFDYRIPAKLIPAAKIGKRAWVPFGRKTKTVGFIVGLSRRSDIKGLKDIGEIIDDAPIFSHPTLKLTRWIADYYFCSWGEALEAALPGALKHGGRREYPSTSATVPAVLSSHRRCPSPQIDQEESLRHLTHAIAHSAHNVFLAPSSYRERFHFHMKAIETALNAGKSALLLVPEIFFARRLCSFLEKHLAQRVILFHSNLTEKQRRLAWEEMTVASSCIVIGTRSAIFAPLKAIGLVIVDEEHSHLYKQEEVPRYHARDVAIKRGEIERFPVLLGSLTPSLESFYNARQKKYIVVSFPSRFRAPQIEAIDLGAEVERLRGGENYLSRRLERAIADALARREKVALFLNRRGFSTSLLCPKCGEAMRCPRCNVSLVYHLGTKEVRCHYCHFRAPAPDICPNCRSSYIKYRGMGTERLESETGRLFPTARILRVDRDSAVVKRSRFQRTEDFLKKGDVDILIGTSMVGQLLELMAPSLLAIVGADALLNLPDFRAAEKTFSLFYHLIDAMKDDGEGKKVLIQTHHPTHCLINALRQSDPLEFYLTELALRQEANYPPFTHVVKIVWRGKRKSAVITSAGAATRKIEGYKKTFELIGPTPDPAPKRRGMYQYSLLIKSKKIEPLLAVLKKTISGSGRSSGVVVTIDVDPL